MESTNMWELPGYEYLYADELIDAGEYAPRGFEPDFSFFADENFRQLTEDERIILKAYDMSTLSQKQFVVGFGGVHSFDPTTKLFGQTKESVDYFIHLIGGETERAIGIFEGGKRALDLTMADEQIFESYGEIGQAQALCQRVGIEITASEPLVGLDALAKKYGALAVLQYLSLRILPQWYLIDPAKRPDPNEYIVSIFRSRPYLSYLKHLHRVDSYIWELIFRSKSFTMPYDIPIPGRQECLRQTTHEYIVGLPVNERTITQQVALDHNIQRIKRLYSDISLYRGQGRHVYFIYGDVHVRALDEVLCKDAEAMRIGRAKPPSFLEAAALLKVRRPHM